MVGPEYLMTSSNQVFIVAEIGSVHDGSLGNALALANMCANAGANAVKFQTHIAQSETLKNAPMPPGFTGEPRYEYFERTGFSIQEWRYLSEGCQKLGIEFMSAPFSSEAAELLNDIGMQRYKIPSGEITNIPLLEKIATFAKPVILSSGMSYISELDDAVKSIRQYHNEITVLQCTSAYPCEYKRVGLQVIPEIKKRYSTEVGLSDHTPTNYASFAAVAHGATYIEKHVTFSRSMYGSDAANAIEPGELVDLVNGVRAIEEIMGSSLTKDQITDSVKHIKSIFEKSIVSISPIKKGEVIQSEKLGFKKPGDGVSPKELSYVLGKVATRDIPAETTFRETDFE
jgi:N,N'-diacetyllegionaminate synthase